MSIESRAALPSCVQLEGLVLLKILRHCEGSLGRTGVMQGICMEGNVLEVTHCFGEPVKEESFEEADEGLLDFVVSIFLLPSSLVFSLPFLDSTHAAFQKQKMEALKDLNVDNNTVGWFASVDLSLWMPKSTIDSQYNYQKSIPDSIFLAYDPTRTAQGRIVLRAFRLTQSFMNFYSTNPSFVPSHSGFVFCVALSLIHHHIIALRFSFFFDVVFGLIACGPPRTLSILGGWKKPQQLRKAQNLVSRNLGGASRESAQFLPRPRLPV